MPTKYETDCMQDIQKIVNEWTMNSIPTWRAIQKVQEILLKFQKEDWNRNHS